MADEEMERSVPRNTSEATPPHAADSPEMVSQPSTPEEQRVSSSTDQQPAVVSDSFDAQGVSSTSDLQPNAGDEALNRLSAEEILLPGTNEAGTGEGGRPSIPTQSSSNVPEVESGSQPDAPSGSTLRSLLDAPSGSTLRSLLEAPPAVPGSGVQLIIHGPLIFGGMVGATVGSPASSKATHKNLLEGGFLFFSSGLSIKATKQNVGETSGYSNQQIDVDDSSSVSKSSPENIDLGGDSSTIGSGKDEQKGSQSSTTETGCLDNDSSTTNAAAAKESCSKTLSEVYPKSSLFLLLSLCDAMNARKTENESSPSKTESGMSVSGSNTNENVASGIGSSPSKLHSSGMEALDLADKPERERQVFSPKRKSPAKFQHLSPKRSSPLPSPSKHKVQSDSQMSTLLDELDIKTTDSDPIGSETTSGVEQQVCIEPDESLNAVASMEEQKSDSQVEREAESDDSEMEESE